MLWGQIFLISLVIILGSCADLPTLYEYYTADGISSGLSVDQPYFTLNGKNISIHSGAIHYFRVPPQYWRDRLRKLRATGLNAVETYVAWNLHEPQNGVFDFGDGGSDYEQFLDIETFLQLAQEEDLFVVLRPGPYICSEWELGGLPSWLLAEDAIVRSTDEKYVYYAKRYFEKMLAIVSKYQFTRGGPIIAFQIENEYGTSWYHQREHIQQLYEIMLDNDIVELLFTSDIIDVGSSGTIPGVIFQTVNSDNPVSAFPQLAEIEPGQPLMVMEFYPGWADYWFEKHTTQNSNTSVFREKFEGILTYPASFNLYMFHGGSNWAFFNGAVYGIGDTYEYLPATSSYDYNAPLSEAGDYAERCYVIKELLEKYNTLKTKLPDLPEQVERQPYPTIKIESQLSFNDIMSQAPLSFENETPLSMEKLPINNNSGQSYGYVVYHKEHLDLPANSVLRIADHIRDTVMVLINGELVSPILTSMDDLDKFGFWRLADSSLTLTSVDLEDVSLDIVVENWGRGHYGPMNTQLKGLVENNTVFLNDEELTSWTIYPLEFKKSWTTQLTGWKTIGNEELIKGPGLYKATLTIDDSVNYDNFINVQGWNKGMVIVNGFPLSKYVFLGPQQTLYLPRPFLQNGDNEIIFFEHFEPATKINFSDKVIYNNPYGI